MRREEFKKYLMMQKRLGGKRYSESTAEERARCCSTIEKEYGVDLDKIVPSTSDSQNLLKTVETIEKTHASTFCHSLEAYFAFVKENPNIMPQKGADEIGEYISYVNDVPTSEQIIGLCAYLEIEYSKILDFTGKLLDGNIYRRDLIKIPVKLTCKNGVSNFIYTDESAPYIELSYNIVEETNWRIYTATLANALFFQYIRYMEYSCCKRARVTPFGEPYLSAAVADFSAMLYSINRGRFADLMVASNKYNEWTQHFSIGCPCHNAYALFFYIVDGNKMAYSDYYEKYVYHNSVEKLKKTFDKIHDCESAFDIMLNA